ncbi:MAG: hypothetical protein ABSG53_21745, partial [Thermoguttaceae bacterium]
GCSILGLVLVAIVCGYSTACALAATEPVDGAAIGTAINPPLADRILDAPAPDKPAAPVLTGNPLWAVPLRALSITRERPLFSPSRRPPAPAMVAAPPAPHARPAPKPGEPDHPLLTLVGTIVGKTQSIAIFADEVAKNVIHLKTGQDHAGWTLRAIQGRQATFDKDRREATLALPARSAAQTGPAIPGPAPVMGPPQGSWVDGDGRHVSPPNSPKPPWMSPPPAQTGASPHKPSVGK